MKKFLLLVAFVQCFASIFAQSPDWKWAKNFDAFTTSVAADEQGNCYVAGSFINPSLLLDSILLLNSNGTTFPNLFLAKYSPNGKVIWAKSAGSTSEIRAMQVDGGGNVLVLGNFGGTLVLGSDTLVNNGANGNDIFIAKFDSLGTIAWAHALSGNSDDYAKCIALDAAGNVFISGDYHSSSLQLDTINLLNPAGQGTFIAKYSVNGNLLWARAANVSNIGRSYGLSTDFAGNCYWVGTYDGSNISFGTKTLNSPGPGSFFLFTVKYDAFGNALWAKRGMGYNLNAALVTDSAGNSFVTGSFLDPSLSFDAIMLNNANLNTADLFVAKYDTYGNVLWAKRYGNSSNDEAHSIAIDKLGNPIITGFFDASSISFGLYVLPNKTNGLSRDIFCTKFSPDGAVLWGKSAGGYGQDEGQSLAVDGASNVFVSGSLASTAIEFGGDTLFYTNGQSFFAKMDSVPTHACSSFFTIYPDTLPHHYFVLNQAVGHVPIDYLWTWGDGNVSSGATPTYTYSTNGIYSICLSTIDSMGCIAVYCSPSDYYFKNASNAGLITMTVISANPTGSENLLEKIPEVKIYPNPSLGEFEIFSDEMIQYISIQTVLGTSLFDSHPNAKVLHLNFLKDGIYVVTTRGVNYSSTQKLIVQH